MAFLEPLDLYSQECKINSLTVGPSPATTSTQPFTNDNTTSNTQEGSRDINYYIPLYKAIAKGNWEAAKRFLDEDPDAVRAKISSTSKTALHIAVIAGQTVIVEKLLQLMHPEDIAIQDLGGNTALHYASFSGITKHAMAMVRMNPNLTQINNNISLTPMLCSALCCHKEILWYLCSVTTDEAPSPFNGDFGVKLMNFTIAADFFDVALHLIERYPHLATEIDESTRATALEMLASKPSSFQSGSHLGFWNRCIYSCVRVDINSIHDNPIRGNVEDPRESLEDCPHMLQVFQCLKRRLWNIIKLVPCIKHIHDTKLMHLQALELVKCLSAKVLLQDHTQLWTFFGRTTFLLEALRNGIPEIIAEFLENYPELLFTKIGDQFMFHFAVKFRQERIFSLTYENWMTTTTQSVFTYATDSKNNNVLHLAAKLSPFHRLNSVTGAALQLQRELQWYKEIDKMVIPICRQSTNSDEKTPRELFTIEHQDLLKKGERWMKDTATSCMLVATLIATMVFVVALTVPGGNNNNNGKPIFFGKKSFTIFVMSDALAFLSSSTSILMFLAILTSRYAEEDFLKSLPQKLIIGLATLFFSIATMMIAFSTTLFIMFGQEMMLMPILIALLSCFPVTLFALLQFPLFVEIFLSTYGPSIFNRH